LKLKFSRFFATILGLAMLAGIGVVAHSDATVASADGFGRTPVTFTKWVTSYPNMAGVVGGDVGTGSFAGEILTYDPTLGGGKVTKITADYHLNGGVHQSTARVTVWQFDNKFAVVSGGVISGWRKGASVYGIYKVIQCSDAPDGTCFQGTLYLTGSAP
jgi:hypothetical protein